ncbi:MAG: adenylate/guanylate cyclase domain-containing protein [Cyanobacteria bacterium P01_D01_bin.128]
MVFNRWRRWRGKVSALPQIEAIAVVAIAGFMLGSLTLGADALGLFQALELKVFDRMIRLRQQFAPPVSTIDDRLLIVGITDEDIQLLEHYPVRDEILADALAILQRHNPAVMGLDLYRDVPQPPGRDALMAQIQQHQVVVIQKLGDRDSTGTPAPDGVDSALIGFNDFVVDGDGIVRRNLLFSAVDDSPDASVLPSFGLQLALRYLEQQDIVSRPWALDPNIMELGEAVFVPLSSDFGGYQVVDALGYQTFLDYRSSAQVARHVSLSQILSGAFDPAWVEGKIVMLGAVTPSAKDLFYTPFSAGAADQQQMTGVNLHAQAVSHLLDAALAKRPLWTAAAQWQFALWVYLWAVLAGSLAWQTRHPLLLMLMQMASLLGLALAGGIFFLNYVWMPLVGPLVAMVGASATVLAYRAQQSYRQRQMMLVLLGQSTSPEIAAALWDNRDRLLKSGKLPGQRLTATMLFTDIKGFSTIAEQTSPERLLDLLNEYLEGMATEIQRHHGIINKFTGDGLLAVFGVPLARQHPREIAEDAQAAVSCALAMGDRLTALNQQWARQHGTSLKMRVGIFTGPVVAGSLGGRDRLEYGIIGDSVNIASRLESCEKERHDGICRILIGQETLDQLQNQFWVNPWGELILKGRSQPVTVYQVVARKPKTIPSSQQSAKVTSSASTG